MRNKISIQKNSNCLSNCLVLWVVSTACKLFYLSGKGIPTKPGNHPPPLHKRGGPWMWISYLGGSLWLDKIPYCENYKFWKLSSKGGQSIWIRFFVNFRHFWCFFDLYIYLYIYSGIKPYLAMTKKKRKTLLNRNVKILLILIKMDKAEGGVTWMCITILIVNIINFAKVDKGGGVKRLSTKSG